MRRGAWLVPLAVACGDPTVRGGIGRVRIALIETNDTVRFEIPVTALRCGGAERGGAGLLVHGERFGQGVLVWLRGERPDTGSYPLLTRGDTVAPRGAIAAVRFLVGDVAHGLTLDDGVVTVTRAAPPFELAIRGRGVETAVAAQRTAAVELERVTLGPDTASCRTQL